MDVEYKSRIRELEETIKKLQDGNEETLRNFECAIVETKGDMRIINSYGDVEYIFHDVIDKFERGENLLKFVYKITKNTKTKEENVLENKDDFEQLEDAINKFVEGTRSETTFKVIGEKDNGEVFQLVWKMKRFERFFKSYFKIIPTNSIIKSIQAKHAQEKENIKTYQKQVYEQISDGLVVLDLAQRIIYINEQAKTMFNLNQNQFMKKAGFENRYYKDLFYMETQMDIRDRIDVNRTVLQRKTPTTFVKRTVNMDLFYYISPYYDENRSIVGLMIIIKPANFDAAGRSSDTGKLVEMLKALTQVNKKQQDIIKELETSISTTNKQSKDAHEKLMMLYHYINDLYLAISIQEFPSWRFTLVNKTFERQFNIVRTTIIGKSDNDVFDKDFSFFLEDLKRGESIKNQNIVNFEQYHIVQVPILDNFEYPTHILRIYSLG